MGQPSTENYEMQTAPVSAWPSRPLYSLASAHLSPRPALRAHHTQSPTEQSGSLLPLGFCSLSPLCKECPSSPLALVNFYSSFRTQLTAASSRKPFLTTKAMSVPLLALATPGLSPSRPCSPRIDTAVTHFPSLLQALPGLMLCLFT